MLLTAVVAVFLAALCTVRLPRDRGQVDPFGNPKPDLDREVVVICLLGGLVVGSLAGLVIGANRVRPLPGVFLGTFGGMAAGAATGVLLAVPDKTWPILVGSLVILLLSAVVRRCSGGPPN